MREIVLLTGPSFSGKTSISDEIVRNSNFEKFITDTTRDRREGEHHGEHYYFNRPDDFQKRIGWNDFFEYEEVFTSIFYGFSRKELERLKNKLPVCAVDVNGALKFLGKRDGFINLTSIKPIVFYIFAPHSQLIKRMEDDFESGKRNDTKENLKKRIARLHYELEQEKYFDHPYLVDNSDGNFKNAVNQILTTLERQSIDIRQTY